MTVGEQQSYRITRPVPLLRLEAFCRALQTTLVARYAPAEVLRIWRLYVSAECPMCGLPVCGEELRALAFPPCAEWASAKGGRMRLGYCARSGCEAWHYALHFWNQEAISWPSLLEAAEPAGQDGIPCQKAASWPWLAGVGSLAKEQASRVVVVLVVVVALWLAREFYLGGRIPFLREPEKFRIETVPPNDTWPAPLDGG